MKNSVLCLLSIIIIFLAPAPAHAGFIMKKHAAAQSVQATSNTILTNSNTLTNKEFAKISAKMEKLTSPSGVFVRWLSNGTIGAIALLFGVLGFLSPLFAIGAIIFGFLGMKSFCSSRGLAIVGFVLGLIVVGMAVFGGYTTLPIF